MRKRALMKTSRVTPGTARPAAAALIVAAALTLVPSGLAWAAETPMITVELNKLEAQGKSCRAYFVIDNLGDAALQTLKLDLVLFRTDGVIDRRLALDLSPIRPNKKSVKIFELNDLACEGIGSVLLNEIAECRDATGPVAGCGDKVTVSSRATAPFAK